MSRMPSLAADEVLRALSRAGFQRIRQRGSHLMMRHPDGRTTVVPVHHRQIIGPGLMSKILRDTEMTREEFQALL
ncbi:MAG: type II toxin-antitoxin system HicA family toxin [Chloroflexi bacterium]|nr:type II toxin-antitoxin system HicA family toxin [Chloroflexota bacterium]